MHTKVDEDLKKRKTNDINSPAPTNTAAPTVSASMTACQHIAREFSNAKLVVNPQPFDVRIACFDALGEDVDERGAHSSDFTIPAGQGLSSLPSSRPPVVVSGMTPGAVKQRNA